MKYLFSILFFFFCLAFTMPVLAEPCPFDQSKTCNLQRNILVDKDSYGRNYFAAITHKYQLSNHEINSYDEALAQPYTDQVNLPGQLKLAANATNTQATLWKSAGITTRGRVAADHTDNRSAAWNTNELTHGYLEVTVKMPNCEVGDNGLCQNKKNPLSYNVGLLPAIRLVPVMDANWPQNGEIDLAKAYLANTDFNTTNAELHFNGGSSRCGNGDCVNAGFPLSQNAVDGQLYNAFHRWGFEWQRDPNNINSMIITGYLDNHKIWGPISTNSLPADGANALQRGFNGTQGGYYLMVNLALGHTFAGKPHTPMQSASMYIQSIKAFAIGGSNVARCEPPANIQSIVMPDKKQITLSWQEPTNSSFILNYQVNDYQNRILWMSTNKSKHCYTDTTLPGTPGTFTYYLYSNCMSGRSAGVKFNVVIK